MKIAGLVEERGGHSAPIQFTGSPGIYQYHYENIPVKEMKCDLFPNRLILEKSWNFVFMFLYKP